MAHSLKQLNRLKDELQKQDTIFYHTGGYG